MFVDFNKVFGNTPQTELIIPQALIDQLSEKLPDGLIYVVDSETNNLTISHDGKQNLKVTIGGMVLVPTEQQKAILGEKFSLNDIMRLSYNSQTPVPVRLKNDKYVTINGKDVPIEKLSYNPFKPYEIKIDSTYIYPSPFPPAFIIRIGNENSQIELSMHRIPNNSLETMAFESDDSKCLSIKYYINPVTHSLSITFNISIKNAETVQEIIEAIEIYNAFIEGKGYIFDSLIETRMDASQTSIYDDEVLEFWNKVKELEDKLNISIDPHGSELGFEDICNIEEIYQNIINMTPIKRKASINTITSKWEFSKDSIVADTLGKPVYFEFEGNSSNVLFGQTIDLPCIVEVFNAVLVDYEKNEATEECTLFLDNESVEKQMYTSTLRFVSKEELLKYKNEVVDRMTIFRDAKKRHEYLIKN